MLQISKLNFQKAFATERQLQALGLLQGISYKPYPNCSRLRCTRAQSSSGDRPCPVAMRVWAISDIHTDYPDNLKWLVSPKRLERVRNFSHLAPLPAEAFQMAGRCENLSLTEYQPDALVVAGEQCCFTKRSWRLASLFRHKL